MRIEENHFTLKTTINTPFPEDTILKIRDMASFYGNIIENEASHSTSGPKNRIKMSFDIIEHIDEHTSMNLFFSLIGLHNGISIVDVSIEGILRMEIDQSNKFFYSSFHDFYTEKIYPEIRKRTEHKIKKIGGEIEKKVKALEQNK